MPKISSLPGIARRASKLTLALSVLLASLGTSITNVALPTLAEAFSAPFAQVQAVVVSYLAALTVSVVIAGRLGDRYGLRPMLIAGLGVFTVASLLCALAPGLWLLVAARGLQGAGAAFLMTLGMAMLRQVASEGRIGRAMGLLGTVSALGPCRPWHTPRGYRPRPSRAQAQWSGHRFRHKGAWPWLPTPRTS